MINLAVVRTVLNLWRGLTTLIMMGPSYAGTVISSERERRGIPLKTFLIVLFQSVHPAVHSVHSQHYRRNNEGGREILPQTLLRL